jgi:ribosomal protein S18 acetylase RimI-like enzyme
MNGTLPEIANGLSIRRATLADLPAIVRLMAEDHLGSQREHYSEALPPAYGAAFAAIDADPNNELIVATFDERVIGTLQLTYIQYLSYQGSRRAQVESIRIDANLRGQGLGSTMVEWAIARSRSKGCYLLQLTSNIARTEAHRFYERLGFKASHVGMKITL